MSEINKSAEARINILAPNYFKNDQEYKQAKAKDLSIDITSDALDFLVFTDLADELVTIILPLLSMLGFFLNFIVFIVFFHKSIYKLSSFYRYVACIVIFDLCLQFLTLAKPVVKVVLTENMSIFYTYVYLTSVSLLCSNITKLLMAVDNLTKVSGQYRQVFRRYQSSTLINGAMIFSAIACFPLVLERRSFAATWFKQTYFEQTLNPYGINRSAGLLAMMNGMLINGGILFASTISTRYLWRTLKASSLRISEMETQQCDFDDFGLETSVRDLEGCTSPIRLEKARNNQTKMILTCHLLYLLGHIGFVLNSFIEQMFNLIYGVEYKQGYEDFALSNIGANTVLYTSCVFYSFVYFYFLDRLRNEIVTAFACAMCRLCCHLEQLKNKTRHMKS